MTNHHSTATSQNPKTDTTSRQWYFPPKISKWIQKPNTPQNAVITTKQQWKPPQRSNTTSMQDYLRKRKRNDEPELLIGKLEVDGDEAKDQTTLEI